MKDWTGNKNSIYKTLGASNHTDKEREVHDYYATEPKALELLLEKEQFSPYIWECACGGGHLSKVLIDKGFNVKSSDIVDRGFEWNDGVAAEKYRESQAGSLIRNLTVKMITPDVEQTEPVRAYVSIRQADSSEFISVHNVLKDEDLTRKMLEQAKSELDSFAKKYSTLRELSKVFDAIAEINAK